MFSKRDLFFLQDEDLLITYLLEKRRNAIVARVERRKVSYYRGDKFDKSARSSRFDKSSPSRATPSSRVTPPSRVTPSESFQESPVASSVYKLPEIEDSQASVADLPFLREEEGGLKSLDRDFTGSDVRTSIPMLPPSPLASIRLPPPSPKNLTKAGSSVPTLPPSPLASVRLPPLSPKINAGSSFSLKSSTDNLLSTPTVSPSSLPYLPLSPSSSVVSLPPLSPGRSSLPPMSAMPITPSSSLLPPLSQLADELKPSGSSVPSLPSLPSSPAPQTKKLPPLSKLSVLK